MHLDHGYILSLVVSQWTSLRGTLLSLFDIFIDHDATVVPDAPAIAASATSYYLET